MMFLKRLDIKGFKSFADPVSIDFEPGVTVVVGPNGSGKSNVVDAVAWVLGAQAPSAVRSQKMDDVVFAGTASRQALGRAVVSLTIDNSLGRLPIEFSEVTVTRTLFRGGDSEYALNGAPCRLLDIQELLSDVGVGRQQHVIISQGQIDAVLNARLEDRRAIIEDAAGILKYRKRREKAERRLESTRSNLDRLGDLQKEVRRQLRPLERQAEAARRHSGLVGELRSLRRFRTGQELVELRNRSSNEAHKRAEYVENEALYAKQLKVVESEIHVFESELADRGEDDLGDLLVRFETLSERARGLRGVLAERIKGIERDRSSVPSEQVIFNLKAELARAEGEVSRLKSEMNVLASDAEDLTCAEIDLSDDWKKFEVDWLYDAPPIGGQAAEVRGKLGVLSAAAGQHSRDQKHLTDRLNSLNETAAALEEQIKGLQAGILDGEETEKRLVVDFSKLEVRCSDSDQACETAWEKVVSAEAELHGSRARVEALRQALAESRSQAGADRLSGARGVLGTLSDLVEVDENYERAFEAAVSDALDSVVIDGTDETCMAIEALCKDSLSSGILVNELGTSKVLIPPNFGEPLRPRVHSRDNRISPLLDRLMANTVVLEGDLVEVVNTVLENPGVTVVTPNGDYFGPTFWRIGADGSRATKFSLIESEKRLSATELECDRARGFFDNLQAEAKEAERARAVLVRELDDYDNWFTATTESLQQVQTERRSVITEIESLQRRLKDLIERSEDNSCRINELEVKLGELEKAEEVSAQATRDMNTQRNILESRSTELSAQRTSYEVRSADVEGRFAVVQNRVVELNQSLEQLSDEHLEAVNRRLSIDGREKATCWLMDRLDERTRLIDVQLRILRENRQKQSDRVRTLAERLDDLRKKRSDATEALSGIRDRQSRLEIDRAETRLRLENLVEVARTEFGEEFETLVEASCPDLIEGVTADDRILELERELQLMGPINALALQEFETLQERCEFLGEQLDDVRSTRNELRKVIKSIDLEIQTVFSNAFGEISEHFAELFETLFPGGHGELSLTEPEDLLNTGVEIEARPSGKNVKKLSLLSGGERSLTALAFLFAVFRSRPSPFYIMDEVEAALDDMNLNRFLSLIGQFRNSAQLMIVSHQKRTMEAADCLYGVSMAPGGSSKVVSERIEVSQETSDIKAIAS